MTVLVLVSGFSLEAATAKTSFVSNVSSCTRILYKGTHVANQDIFVVFKVLIIVKGFSTKSVHDGDTWVHHLGTPGHTWVHLGAPRYTWVHLRVGYTWVRLGTCGNTWAHLGGTPGYTQCS